MEAIRWQWGLALAALLILGCPSRQSPDEPDQAVLEGDDLAGCGAGDCQEATASDSVDGGPNYLMVEVEAPGPCGWASAGQATIPVSAILSLDGEVVPGHPVDRFDLFYVDPETDEELLLDTLENVASGSLIFDATEVPGGLEGFADGAPEALLRIVATVTLADGAILLATGNRTLVVDTVAPVIEILVPTSGSLVTPYVELVPYTVVVTDEGSGFGDVSFVAAGVELEAVSSGLLSEPPKTTLTGLLDASPLGVATTSLAVEVTDCTGNSAIGVVPLAVVSKPKFLKAPTVSCEEVKDQLFVKNMRRVRAGHGDGDGDEAYTDLILAAGEGAYVAWALGGGDFAPLQMAAPGNKVRDAHFVELSGDGVPDLAVLTRNPEEAGFVVTEWTQAVSGEGEGLRLFLEGKSHVVGDDPFIMEVADIDGDGFPDLLVGHSVEEESVMLLRHTGVDGGGGAHLEEASILTGIADISDLKLGDVNGDGQPDIVVTRGKAGILSTYLNSGGSFLMAHDTLLMGQDVPLLGLGDFNSDGKSDAMVVVRDLGAAYELNGKGNGYFEQTSHEDLGWSMEATEAVASIFSTVLQENRIPKAGQASRCGALLPRFQPRFILNGWMLGVCLPIAFWRRILTSTGVPTSWP